MQINIDFVLTILIFICTFVMLSATKQIIIINKTMTTILNFRNLVLECTNSATSDLSVKIKAMLAYANENATDEDIENFMDWLGEETMWDNTGIIENSNPEDNFECLEGMTWEELRTWYKENN